MKLVTHREVECDLQESCCYYRERDERLPERFLLEYENVVGLILSQPLLGRCGPQNVRQVSLRRFPFGIYYQVFDDSLFIGAVVHLSRDESIWLHRFD